NPTTCPADCHCGNGLCDQGETLATCPTDCTCGNGKCDGVETVATCPADCKADKCGNTVCDQGETPTTCPADCPADPCGNGVCDSGETISNCPVDCTCGNGTCEQTETPTSCPADCTCGNGVCDPNESATSCPADCTCGDGSCEGDETPTNCPADCVPQTCGNSRCDMGETLANCPGDCPVGTCAEGSNLCVDVDHLRSCVNQKWVEKDCLTLCQATGDFPMGCQASTPAGQDVCECTAKAQYGNPCTLNAGDCASPLWCVHTEVNKTTGICTMQCDAPNTACTSVPDGKAATCSPQLISDRTFCAFTCDGQTACPLGMTCPANGGTCQYP
ncbi:MAG: hypothetical protein JRH20_20780, partial [Deltaproteobacteria bacterium]|nr:hypothetical protein [Deltaproteobacteria bacterium]